jgi:hypothetical protein
VKDIRKGLPLGGGKGYDTADFVKELPSLKITPHVAQNDTNRKSAIDGRTTKHPNYAVSQRIRKRIEEGFGWMKTIGRIRKTMYSGIEKIAWQLDLHAAAYNLVRKTWALVSPDRGNCPREARNINKTS